MVREIVFDTETTGFNVNEGDRLVEIGAVELINHIPTQMHRWMAEEYAKARNFDVEKCFELMRAYRSVQPGKIDNLY